MSGVPRGDVERPPADPGVGGRSSRSSGIGQEALPEVREWTGGPPGGPGVDWMPSRWSGSGWKALTEVREWSVVVRRSSRRSGSGREALTEVQEWSGGHPGGLGGPPVGPIVV